MSNYKRYFIKQLGLGESLKPSDIQPSEVDPKELEMGVEDEKEHSNDPKTQQTIALQHLKDTPNYYTRLNNAGLEETGVPPQKRTSPSAISTPVIAMAIRGSSTGGLPSGADRNMELPQNGMDVSNLSPSQLGGYEPIPTAKDNSKIVNKTPKNSQINSSDVIANSEVSDDTTDNHPHQFQQAQGEAPQAVTGASTDSDNSLKLKMAMPKGVDVDIAEGDDEDNNSNNPEFKEKDQDQFRKDRSASPEGDDVRKQLGMNETFARHLKLMNETIDSRNLNQSGSDDKSEVKTPDKIEEKYAAPFAKMRGLANLGERRVSKNGLWESSHKPGENFETHWKMDKEKAGMVKVDESKLLSVKEFLSKKSSLNEKESNVLKQIEEVLKKRSSNNSAK